MRGCLFVLLTGVLVLVGVVWFAGPPVAGTLVETTLTAAGLNADEMDVTVETDPPLALATGRADRVSIDARGVTWNEVRAGRLTLELGGVDLFGRTARTADGEIDDVELALTGEDDEPLLVAIVFSGPANAALTAVSIDGPTTEALAAAAFTEELDIAPDRVTLVAPDTIRFEAAGSSVDGTLAVGVGGRIEAATLLGTVTVFETSGLPLRLTDLSLGPDGLEVTGTLDVASLLR